VGAGGAGGRLCGGEGGFSAGSAAVRTAYAATDVRPVRACVRPRVAAPRRDAQDRLYPARRAAGRRGRGRRDRPLLEPLREQAASDRRLRRIRRARLREGGAELHRPAGAPGQPHHDGDPDRRDGRGSQAQVPPLLAADPTGQRRDQAQLAEGDPAAINRERCRAACAGPSSRARRRSPRRRRSRSRRSRNRARSTRRARASRC
jgi:hypothetical protein